MGEPQKAYQFPFSTCEESILYSVGSSTFYSQPYSASINLLIIFLLVSLFFLYKPKPMATTFIALLILFESWHLLSHAFHFVNTIYPMIVIHILAYLIAIQIWRMFLILDPIQQKNIWKIAIVLIYFIVDVVLLISVRGHISVLSGTLLIFLLFVLYFSSLPKALRLWILWVFIPLGMLGIFLFLNEHSHCKQMMETYRFPYHTFVEIVVGLFILAMAYLFIRLGI
jgi:hypothetical protein